MNTDYPSQLENVNYPVAEGYGEPQPVLAKTIANIEGYTVVAKIGQGAFGVVYKAFKNTDPYTFYAIKEVKKFQLSRNKKLERCFHTEIEIMRTIYHENIMHCYDVVSDDIYYFQVLDLCEEGDVEQFILNSPIKCVDEAQAVKWLQQILNGFCRLHEKQVMHRDFKPANVMLKDGNAVIGDFGFAKMASQGLTKCGTPVTMAPEIMHLGEGETFSNSVDIWSIGVTYYMMLIKFSGPFECKNMADLKRSIMKTSGKNLDFYTINDVSEESLDLMREMIVDRPEERIEWGNIFHHRLFNKWPMSEEFKNNRKKFPMKNTGGCCTIM